MTRHSAERLEDVLTAVAGTRDRLAHRYLDTSHAIVAATVANDPPLLAAAVGRLTVRLAPLE